MTWKTSTHTHLKASAVLSDSLPLPPKPAPHKPGQPVVWVDVLDADAGGFFYKGRLHPVDEGEMDRMALQYRDFVSAGYLPPVLREHEDTGEREGHVLDLQKWGDPRRGGAPTLIAALQINVPDAQGKLDRQQIFYFSPGIGHVEDFRTGKVWRDVINEVSLVGKPHRKTTAHILGAEVQIDPGANTGAPTNINKVAPPGASTNEVHMADNATPPTPPGPGANSPEQRLDGLEQRVGGIETGMGEIKTMLQDAFTKMMEPTPEPKADPAEPPAEMAEVAKLKEESLKLKEQMAQLQTERDQAKFNEGYVAGASVTLSEDAKSAWFDIASKCPEQFKAVMKSAKRPGVQPPAPGVPGAPPAPNTLPINAWTDTPLGESTFDPPAPKKLTGKDVVRMAKEAGVPTKTMHTQLVTEGRI